MSLGMTIRDLRSKRNMSQADLAEALAVSRQSVSKWETDSAVPDLDDFGDVMKRASRILEAGLGLLYRLEVTIALNILSILQP
ncbi:MAG: helix-turn-helix transcriptional regulator [Clostridiales bacterium]